jgi:NAD(P)-dependent dehydrogenase (short-subunit alcohol dehydrogenase family)
MTDAVFALTGKRVLVTGGTRGIGRAISTQLSRSGARVIASHARDDGAAESLVDELAAEGRAVSLCRGDLTTDAGRQHVLDAIGGDSLSAFVHCAATGVHRPLADLTLRHWDFTFALNLRAFFDLVTQMLPRFSNPASIVAVSSEGAVTRFPTTPSSVPAKAASRRCAAVSRSNWPRAVCESMCCLRAAC